LLGIVQMRNFCVGKTTNERYARRADKQYDTSSSAVSRYSGEDSLTIDTQLLEQEKR
jgi:hypothetical protein